MSDYTGAWSKPSGRGLLSGTRAPQCSCGPEGPKEIVPTWDFAAFRKSSPEGPWGGIEDLFPEGKAQLPRSAGGFLKAARESGWGFGPISLVMRLNRADARPLYVSWLYSTTSSSWSFGGAGVKGHHIAKATEALALVKTEPWAPDWSRYEIGGDWGGRVDARCRDCDSWMKLPAVELPELLKAIENHEKEHHVD
ncbi:hypothetical protein [Actinocorallia libanotica]|uniref:Uncharacterized protein n=1 Tax=Actinocorallia libanotica TaxID=46162 RepID=A0ABN1Q2F2_9ACTN